MFIGFVAALGVAACSISSTRCSPPTPSRWASLLAAIIIFAIGFIDDIRDIPPPAKVTGTVLAGIVLVWFGVTMFYFRVPFFGRDRPLATTGCRSSPCCGCSA